MNFNKELKALRESQRLSLEDAAEKLHLSVRAYVDRENNRADINIPEKVGLLVGLGIEYEKALYLAVQGNVYIAGDREMADDIEKRWADPFVKETDSLFVLICRDHDTLDYEIPKERIKNAIDILSWISHVTDKTWITREHIQHFTYLATNYLKLSLPYV